MWETSGVAPWWPSWRTQLIRLHTGFQSSWLLRIRELLHNLYVYRKHISKIILEARGQISDTVGAKNGVCWIEGTESKHAVISAPFRGSPKSLASRKNTHSTQRWPVNYIRQHDPASPPAFYSSPLCLYPFHLTASTISPSNTHSHTHTHSGTLFPSLSLPYTHCSLAVSLSCLHFTCTSLHFFFHFLPSSLVNCLSSARDTQIFSLLSH